MNKYYQDPKTNKTKGMVTQGKFVSTAKGVGQKPGKKAPVGKEKLSKYEQVHAKLRKISKAMFARKAAHNNDVAMRAQLNA